MIGNFPETADLAAALESFAQAHRSYKERVANKHGLHPTDLAAASALLREPRTPRQLEQILELTSGSITPLIDRLEKDGYAVRVPSQTDRRSVTVTLTRSGRTLARTTARDFARLVTDSDARGQVNAEQLRTVAAALIAAAR